MTTTPARYTPCSQPYAWANQARQVIGLIEESKGIPNPNLQGDFFPLGYNQCEDLLELAGDIPSWEGHVYMDRQDVLERPSFVWDLSNGEIPATGSRQTVGHTPFLLGSATGITPHRVKAEIPKGEYCPLRGFSYAACHNALSGVMAVLGKDWTYKISLKQAEYEWSINELQMVASHKEVHDLILGIVAEGQGTLRAMGGPSFNLLKDAAEGVSFVSVLDTDHGRKRRGQILPDGEYWQYP